MAGKLAIVGAEPLQHNGYKLPLMRNLVKRAIRGVPGDRSHSLTTFTRNSTSNGGPERSGPLCF